MLQTSEYRNPYLANGSQFLFYYTFLVHYSGEMRVTVGGVLQIKDVNYHISGVGEEEGGTVSLGYLNESEEWVNLPPAEDTIVILERQVGYTQLLGLTERGPFPAKAIEAALDRMAMMCQQLARIILWGAPIETITHLSTDPDTSGWGAEHLGYTWINTVDGHKKMWNGSEIVIDA